MESYADVGCILKVNVHCEACRLKVYEVLRSISGVYSVTIDADEGLARIEGEVDPNILLGALGRTGKHAELKWVKLRSPVPKRGYYDDHGYGYGSRGYTYNQPYSYIEQQPYRIRTTTLPGAWYENHPDYPRYGYPLSSGGHYSYDPLSSGGHYSYDHPIRRSHM